MRVYFMAPVRGIEGDAVSPAEKKENIGIALQVADWVEQHFPDFNLFIPHKYEGILEIQMKQGIMTSEDIIQMYETEAEEYKLGVRFTGNGKSPGADREQDAIIRSGGIVVAFEVTGDEAVELIAKARVRVLEITGDSE